MFSRTFGFIIAFLALVPSTTAQVLNIPEGTTGLTPLEGEIVQLQQVRVPLGDAIMGSETQITLNFTLRGCLDSLMPLIHTYELSEDTVKVHVTALNAHNAESMVANCVAMPSATETITIPGIFSQEQIQMIFMGNLPNTADPAPTSQNTHTSQRFGFSFDYSNELVLDSKGTTTASDSLSLWTQESYTKIQEGFYEGGAEYPPNITVSVHNNPKKQSLVDWANAYQPGVQNVQPITVSGQTGITYFSDGLYPSENVAFYHPKNGKIILLNVSYLDRETSPLVEPFQDIVSSFQLIR